MCQYLNDDSFSILKSTIPYKVYFFNLNAIIKLCRTSFSIYYITKIEGKIKEFIFPNFGFNKLSSIF